MERELQHKLRRRIREVIAARDGTTLAPEPEGGFLPLLAAAAPMVAPLAGKAMGWLGEKLFGSGDEEFDGAGDDEMDGAGDFYGEGKHKEDAKTHNANAHALKVQDLMLKARKRGRPITFAVASKRAKAALARERKKAAARAASGAAPRAAAKPRKAPGAAAKPRKARELSNLDVAAKALQRDWAASGVKITLKQAREAIDGLRPPA